VLGTINNTFTKSTNFTFTNFPTLHEQGCQILI
jgi:hypothetical protein